MAAGFMLRATMLSVSAGLLTACPERTAIWMVPGSTANHLEFEVGRRRGHPDPAAFRYLTMTACHGATKGFLWSVSQDASRRDVRGVSRVRFPKTPPGYGHYGPTGPLLAGCYEASVNGSGRTRVEVQSDGSVVESSVDS